MAALIELKYFNTFWLKKIKKITDVEPGRVAQANSFNSATRNLNMNTTQSETQMNVGQEVTINWLDGLTPVRYVTYIVERVDDQNFILADDPPSAPVLPADIKVGKIVNFDNIPQGYPSSASDADDDWLIEESRIRGGYNNTSVDFGVKAYLVEDEPTQSHRLSSLIHSGVFISRT